MTNKENPYKRKIRILDDPERLLSLPAEDLLALVTIDKSATLLDIGAGTGYLTIPIASKTKETVYALDLDQEILNYLSDKAQEKQIKNIQQVVGDFMEIPLADEMIDNAFASLSLHEVTSLPVALGEIHRVLKKEGQFLCVEFEPKDETNKRRVRSAEMEKGLEQAGFTMKEKIYPEAKFLEQDLYIIVAKKNG